MSKVSLTIAVGLLLALASPAAAAPGNGVGQFIEPAHECSDGVNRGLVHAVGQWSAAYDPATGERFLPTRFALRVAVIASPSSDYPPVGAVVFDDAIEKNRWSPTNVRCQILFELEAEPGFWLEIHSQVWGEIRP